MKKYLNILAAVCAVVFLSHGACAQSEKFEIKRGVNISHWLSQSSARGEARKNYLTRSDVERIAGFGFDHIRIPVDEEQMFSKNGKKDAEAFALLHQALGWCREFGLKAVIDLHILRSHYFNADVKPLFTEEKAQKQFYACWKLLSGELKKYPESMVAYELMNEPVADDPETWNVIVNRCLAEVRKLESDRTVIIGSNRWQNFGTVKDLRLPEGDKNLMISFHYYEPFMLTHYKASWTDQKNYTGPVHYPGLLVSPEEMQAQPDNIREKFGWAANVVYDYKRIENEFRQVAEVAEKWGLPVYCGEFGCIVNAPETPMYRWYRDMASLFDKFGFAFATWDYKGSFGIIRKGEPVWPIIEPLTKQRGDASVEPLSLLPENNKYLMFRNKPVLPITSAEHYGLLINRAFDFDIYFETLACDGLNMTRIFSGAYLEPAGAFNIPDNTLAPAAEFIAPWARSNQPGYKAGGNMFDLERWDSEYFERLHQILQKASEKDVIVELVLFCPFYDDSQWNISPMNAANNIQGIGKVIRTDVYHLDKNKELLAVQEKLTRKLVAELNGYDNLYFEICNEPYFGNVSMDWQRHITDVIVDTEKNLPKKHLISVNVANGSKKVNDPHPAWSILNFHYASPPVAVAENAHIPAVIGLNETGFKGVGDDYYRTEAWEFMLAGGGLYNNLDFSSTVAHPDGTAEVKDPTPGGGSAAFRKQIGFMKDCLESVEFWKMNPADKPEIQGGRDNNRLYVLANKGRAYVVYLRESVPAVTVHLPAGKYKIRKAAPSKAEWLSDEWIEHKGGNLLIEIPESASKDFAATIVLAEAE